MQQPMQFADQLFAAALAAREVTGGDAAAAATSLTGGGATFDSPAAALAAEGRTVLHLFEQPVAPSMFDSYSFEPASIQVPAPVEPPPSLLEAGLRVGAVAAAV